MPQSPKISIFAPAIAADPRQAIANARQYAFAGVTFPVQSPLIHLTELSSTGLREFKHLVHANNLQLAALSLEAPPTGLTPKADIDRVIAHVALACQTAASLQCRTLRFNAGQFPEERPTAALSEIAALADHHGVFIAFRSDLTPLNLLASAVRSTNCPFFGIDLDPPALLAQNINLEQAFNLATGMLLHLTARDAFVGQTNLTQPAPIGQGSVDWKTVVANLSASDYQGWLTVDPMLLSDRQPNALAGLAFLKSLMIP